MLHSILMCSCEALSDPTRARFPPVWGASRAALGHQGPPGSGLALGYQLGLCSALRGREGPRWASWLCSVQRV